MSEMKCAGCGDNEDRIDGYCSVACRDQAQAVRSETEELEARVSELEAELDKMLEVAYEKGYKAGRETHLEAADRLADAVLSGIVKSEPVSGVYAYYPSKFQSGTMYEAAIAYREARVHTSDNAEDFLEELDSPEPVMKTHYNPIKEERARIRERVEQVGSLVRADPDEEWTTGYHDAIADVLTAIQEDTDE